MYQLGSGKVSIFGKLKANNAAFPPPSFVVLGIKPSIL